MQLGLFKRSGHTRALLHFTKVVVVVVVAAFTLDTFNIHPLFLSFFSYLNSFILQDLRATTN